jgi:hypothetical protein
MRARHDIPAGTLHRISVTSEILTQNRLGDPATREVVVYVPHGHDGGRAAASGGYRWLYVRRPGACELEEFWRKRSGAFGPADP